MIKVELYILVILVEKQFMKNLQIGKLSTIALTSVGSTALLSTSAFAAGINVSSLQATKSIGVIGNVAGAFIWMFNLFRYLGWAGVIVGVGLAIFSLIYKLFSGDSEEAMKSVQSYLTKAVIIVIAGILLISAGFIIEQVSALLGVAKQNLTVEVIANT
ncbi:hypothetical protein CO178_01660 [candidate division WWE3 bacterium CG_4_9_14_3_um_filter_34_6]|uniref:Uncharacterized protein n=1 Tax=candidate division WWE3 bacterium CG_4_9_14_3_um_filter_34_6 TaxID=1975079 RepID=A0A2M7X3J3_UNCKA|nr:MAG: hypothetical protein CO178_01660 [candidate division WWE3 bacterium CG_4_9_14_3_um_filter_34_6]